MKLQLRQVETPRMLGRPANSRCLFCFSIFSNLKVSSSHYWNFIKSFIPANKQRITLMSWEYCNISLSLWYRGLFFTPSYPKSNFTAFHNTTSAVMTPFCHHNKIQTWSWFIFLFFFSNFCQVDWNTASPWMDWHDILSRHSWAT